MILAGFQLLGGTIESIDGLAEGRVDMRVLVLVRLLLVEDSSADQHQYDVYACHNEGEDGEVAGKTHSEADDRKGDDAANHQNTTDYLHISRKIALDVNEGNWGGSNAGEAENDRDDDSVDGWHCETQKDADEQDGQGEVGNQPIDQRFFYLFSESVGEHRSQPQDVDSAPYHRVEDFGVVAAPVCHTQHESELKPDILADYERLEGTSVSVERKQ